jgi:site-specific recombinase XerD
LQPVYIFYESNIIRIPVFIYSQRLLDLLTNNGGFWNGEKHEFLFTRKVRPEEFEIFLPNFVIIFVNANSQIQINIIGFFEQKWVSNGEDLSYLKPPNDTDQTGSFHRKSSSEFCDSPFSFIPKHSLPEKLSEDWVALLEAELRSRKYSLQTRRAYIYYNRLICRTLQKKPDEISSDDVTQFLAFMEKDKDYSASAMNLAISAIKFFFINILHKDDIRDRHRPHQDGRLPVVLSKEEVLKVLASENNPKHRLLLMLTYSSGLRVSEVVVLKREHIDFSRKVIYVKQGKGRKDRSTILSEKAAQFLEEYCKFYNIQKWLFSGYPSTTSISIRSAQYIFDKALRNAKIHKNISIHSLRHAFATHLLESGTDIRYIQSLLGHASLRTTERYTHVAKRSILNIKSPLDTIL